MGDSRFARCKSCGRTREEVGELSWSRQCEDCGLGALTDNVEQMHARKGPNWDLWRRNMAASVGGVLLDVRASNGNTHR